MKKTLFILSAFLLMGAGVSHAQSEVVVGDMNNDGVLSVGDVTELTETVVGRKAPRRISVAGNPYAADNSSLVGQWSGVSGTVTFNADGTTDFKAGYTYEYLPSQCLVVLYDETKAAKEFLQVVVLNKGKLVLSDVSMTTAYTYDDHIIEGVAEDGTIYYEDKNGHRYVDLGLPSGTLWATTNVGADNPEDYGDYFAWGEVEPKDTYEKSNYKHLRTNSNMWFAYDKNILDMQDDAAYMNWSEDWCMPNSDQILELHNYKYTTSTWTNLNGVVGQLITSNSNNCSIFLPATGRHCEGLYEEAGKKGYYWSCKKSNLSYGCANYLTILEGSTNDGASYVYFGCSVRPVRKSPKTN